MFEVNVFGGYRVNQTFLPMLLQPGGRIIHISSESLNLEVPFMPYPLTKRLVEGYARVLRMELSFLGIDVVVVRPGAIATRLLETVSGIDPDRAGGRLREQFRRFAGTASGEIGHIITPEAAADFIHKVSCRLKPAAVYRINNMLSLRLAAMLPYSWMERIITGKLKS
jgi:NAD(P)-dependent dehydrogenase (short-subunit alcohol dehydrogenase family)